MKSVAVLTLFAVLFLLVHVAIDHCGLSSVHSVSFHTDCGHEHDQGEDACPHKDDRGVPCEDNHSVVFVRSSFVKNAGVDSFGAFALSPRLEVPTQDILFVQLDLRLTRYGPNPIARPSVLLTTQSLLI